MLDSLRGQETIIAKMAKQSFWWAPDTIEDVVTKASTQQEPSLEEKEW